MLESLHQAYAYLVRGGPVMGLIFLGSVFCVALIIERWVALRREKVLPRKLMSEVMSLAQEKKISEVLALARSSESPVGRILAVGLEKPEQEKGRTQELMELRGRREVSGLERNLDLLGTLAAVGPLLGLLGTVTGMIRTFGVIRVVGVGDPMALSGGISEALLNTAGGLIVGIPALIFQRYYLHRVDRLILEMEEFTQLVLDRLKGA